jgi:hypothetical protein
MLFDYFPPIMSLGIKRSIEMAVRMSMGYMVLLLGMLLFWPDGLGFNLKEMATVVLVGMIIVISPFIFALALIPSIILWMSVGLLTSYILHRFLYRLSPGKATLIGLAGALLILLPIALLLWQPDPSGGRPGLTYGFLLPVGLTYPFLSAWFARSLYQAAMRLFALGQDQIYYRP